MNRIVACFLGNRLYNYLMYGAISLVSKSIECVTLHHTCKQNCLCSSSRMTANCCPPYMDKPNIQNGKQLMAALPYKEIDSQFGGCAYGHLVPGVVITIFGSLCFSSPPPRLTGLQ